MQIPLWERQIASPRFEGMKFATKDDRMKEMLGRLRLRLIIIQYEAKKCI